MKKITALLLALLMALSLCSFACAEEQPTLVRFWHNRSSGANLEACEKAVDELKKLYDIRKEQQQEQLLKAMMSGKRSFEEILKFISDDTAFQCGSIFAF